MRSFTGMDRNGPNYRNGLPEWTLTCAPEYFLCTIVKQSGLSSHSTRFDREIFSLGTEKIEPVWWGARGGS